MKFEHYLYPVISSEFCKGRSPLFVLNEIIKGGATIVQLREKNISKKELSILALQFREITAKSGVALIIDDEIDVALSVHADGVHLGQDDLPLKLARALSKDLIIGVSTHNEDEIREAEKGGATYINIGPIFRTNTKSLSIEPLGLDFLNNIKTSLPFSVMGGIKREHMPILSQMGIKNIACVTEITEADSIRERVSELLTLIKENQKK